LHVYLDHSSFLSRDSHCPLVAATNLFFS
jgi:hypothetical protein